MLVSRVNIRRIILGISKIFYSSFSIGNFEKWCSLKDFPPFYIPFTPDAFFDSKKKTDHGLIRPTSYNLGIYRKLVLRDHLFRTICFFIILYQEVLLSGGAGRQIKIYI